MLGIGIIGAGGIGRHLAREAEALPDVAVEAAVDVNEENLRRVADEIGVDDGSCYESDEAMYAAESLDAAVIATPPAFHHEQIVRALDRDLHVLCEKPLVLDGEEARDVASRVAESPSTLMVGYQRHLDPGFVRARERWQGTDREPTLLTGEFTQDWTDHFASGTNWRTDPAVGGRGHLFSVGTHVVEAALWITGLRLESVSAQMAFHGDEECIDERSALAVRFENGATATFADSAVAPANREQLHVWDDDGAVSLDAENWGRRELTIVDEDGIETTPELDYDDEPTRVAAFVEAVETGTEPPATAEDVRRVTALLDAAYESARTGERVAVDLD